MAWTHDTAEGYMFGSPSKLRVMLFEICRAINQREELWNGTAFTQFYKANGIQTTYPSMSDLYHMPLWGQGNENIMRRNMERINLWINNYASTFYQSGTYDAIPWTIGDLETAIEYEFPASHPEKLTDAAWWQAVIDALNLMIYIRKTPTRVSHTAYFKGADGGEHDDSDPGISLDSSDAAWDDMYLSSEREDTDSFTDLRARISVTYNTSFGGYYTANSVRRAEVIYNTAALPGACTSVAAHVAFNGNSGEEEGTGYTGSAWTVSINDTYDVTGTDPTESETVVAEIPTSEFNFLSTSTATIERTSPALPVDPPFAGEYLGDIAGQYFALATLYFHLDLSSELDDQ